jgi:hypothetical protein
VEFPGLRRVALPYIFRIFVQGFFVLISAGRSLGVNRRGIFTPRIASRRNVTGAVVPRALMDCESHRDLPVLA